MYSCHDCYSYQLTHSVPSLRYTLHNSVYQAKLTFALQHQLFKEMAHFTITPAAWPAPRSRPKATAFV